MKDITIQLYTSKLQEKLVKFYHQAFKESSRKLDLLDKDADILDINANYMSNGIFLCALDNKNNIVGTIAARQINTYHEIRRFFVLKRMQNVGIGSTLLSYTIENLLDRDVSLIKVAVMEEGRGVRCLVERFGFIPTKRYNNSSADIFYRLEVDLKYKYNFKLNRLRKHFECSLILNPTENIPMYNDDNEINFFEGLYISERFKDSSDKIIFAGRNEYIRFFEYVKSEWGHILCAVDVDLKPLAGLNAHLLLFLCILQPGETIMLLPEACGGHFATEQILINLGANVVLMKPDFDNQCVDIEQTTKLINEHNPEYIFIDRSEGLVYEDFSWLSNFNRPYKIFDASQYLSQIMLKKHILPFDMGFDMIVSTLHKNYPGPQKGLLAVKTHDDIWSRYLSNAKTYISNTHPLAIARSLLPAASSHEFKEYSSENIVCTEYLEKELKRLGVPVVERSNNHEATLHIWILCGNTEDNYQYYLKLEQLNLLTNYRLLPYNLGYGLRIGTSAAVRSGLRKRHVKRLARIMSKAYHEPITPSLKQEAKEFISSLSLKDNGIKPYYV